jgi:branched-chain amino acid transport system substrate-binding protein
MLGGASVMDPTSFSVGAPLAGVIGGSPVPLGGTSSAWTSYLSAFNAVYPSTPAGTLASSLFTAIYYNDMNAVIDALKDVKGDLSGGEASFRSSLDGLSLNTPNGPITLDSNRDAGINSYVVKIVTEADGSLGFQTIQTVTNVNENFNGYFTSANLASETQPTC